MVLAKISHTKQSLVLERGHIYLNDVTVRMICETELMTEN